MRTGPSMLVVVLLAAVSVVACGGDDDGGAQDDPTDTTAAPTECLEGEGDMSTTIKITVDDPSDDSGFVSSQTPSGLPAGTTRIDLESDADNKDPLDVPLLLGDEEVFRWIGVEPATTCGVEIDLAAGTYRVVLGENDAEFTIGG